MGGLVDEQQSNLKGKPLSKGLGPTWQVACDEDGVLRGPIAHLRTVQLSGLHHLNAIGGRGDNSKPAAARWRFLPKLKERGSLLVLSEAEARQGRAVLVFTKSSGVVREQSEQCCQHVGQRRLQLRSAADVQTDRARQSLNAAVGEPWVQIYMQLGG